MAEQLVARPGAVTAAPAAPTVPRPRRRRRLVNGDARLVLSEHAKQDKQLLNVLTRLSA